MRYEPTLRNSHCFMSVTSVLILGLHTENCLISTRMPFSPDRQAILIVVRLFLFLYRIAWHGRIELLKALAWNVVSGQNGAGQKFTRRLVGMVSCHLLECAEKCEAA